MSFGDIKMGFGKGTSEWSLISNTWGGAHVFPLKHQHSCSVISPRLWLTPRFKGTFSRGTSDQVLLGQREEMISGAAAPCSALQQPPVKGQCVCACVVPRKSWWERRWGADAGGKVPVPRRHKCPWLWTKHFKIQPKIFRIKASFLKVSAKAAHNSMCERALAPGNDPKFNCS